MRRAIAPSFVALVTAAAATAMTAPQAPPVPAPESVIGFAPCADRKLATYETIAEYFRTLDAASERMQLVEIGETAEGRTQLMAIISSEANMRDLDRFKEISRRLAMARGLTDDQARQLAGEGRAVVWIDFGLHSTEVAHAQTAPLMAYRAVADESAEMRFIRDNVIFLLVPNMNPDGTTLVADWYMQHVGGPYESSSPPELYHRYVGHDNNRDWFMFNMPESRNVARQLYREWFPQIVYNQHQAAPFPARIFHPPFEDPMNVNIPPLVMRGINLVGLAMGRRFDQEGKSGAISRLNFDTWWNGGMRTAPYFHNMVGILTETAHPSATPAVYDPEKFPKQFSDGTPTLEPTTFYPNPYRGGEWRIADSCDYMLTGSMAVLDIGAKRRTEWLYDFYQMGRDALRRGAQETYVISADQWDVGSAVALVNVLRWGGIEVERATTAFAAAGRTHPPGSFLVRGAQPFRAYLTDLLNPQAYPDRRLYPGGPPERPYDITGWTLPLQMGVQVDRLDEAVEVPSEPVEWATVPVADVTGTGDAGFAIDPRWNDAARAVNRLLQDGATVARTTAPFTVNGVEWPAGTFVVTASSVGAVGVAAVAREVGVPVTRLATLPAGDALRLRPLRVGLYHAWGGNMDEGWTRWLLEQYEFPFTSVYDEDVRAGDLAGSYDVIILPDATYTEMLSGLEPGTMPEEYVGGMTPGGVANLYRFAASGGTVIALDTASELPLTVFGLPVRDVTRGRADSEFYIPGTLLRLEVDPSHPVGYGMPASTHAFFAHSPAFAVGRAPSRFERERGLPVPPPDGVEVVASYPAGDLLASGWLMGEDVIAGRAAVLDARVGSGRTVLLAFRTQHRGQPHGTFKLLFNAIYLGASERGPLEPTSQE